MNRLPLLSLLLSLMLLPGHSHAQQQNGNNDFGYGAFLTQETVEEQGQTKNKVTYHVVSQYDPVLRAALAKIGPELDENGKPVKETRLLPNGQHLVYLVRTENTKSNEAILRLVTPVAVSGCVNVVAPKVTVRHGGNMMAVKVEDAAVALNKSVRYAHYQCHQGSNAAIADITLNRDELRENNVKTITFQSGGGSSDTYNVEISGNQLTLIPKSSFAFKPFTNSSKPDPLTYTFYPDNMVILYAPGIKSASETLAEQIDSLARGKGLQPSGQGLKSGSARYFIDESGLLSGSLAFDANAFVGTVKIPEKYQGPDGAYEVEKSIDIYARRPGMLD